MTKHTLFPSLCLVAACTFIAPAASAAEPAVHSWSKPELVGSNDGGDALYPLAGFDDKGNAISIWTQFDGTRYNMWSSRFARGVGWSKPELIEHNDGSEASNHRLAVHSSGTAVAVWMQDSGKPVTKEGPQFETWANRYTPGRGWGNAQLIDVPTPGLTRFPHVALDRKGNAFAVWQRADGNRHDLWASRSTPDNNWSKPELVQSGDNIHAFWAWVSLDGEGNPMVTWHQPERSNTRYDSWANRYTPEKGWEKPQLIENNDAGSAFYPHTVIDGKGNAIAVWQQFDAKTSRIWSNRYSAGQGWGQAEPIDNPDAANSVFPYMEIDANGNATVVWSQGMSGHFSAWSNRYVAGRGWGQAEQISGNAHDLNGVRIAVDANGNAFAVWQQDDRTNYSIWANRYIAGRGWGKAELLEHNDSGHAIGPSIASDGNGHAVAMWHQSDGKLFRIWASRFE